jgi:hypothetical protein
VSNSAVVDFGSRTNSGFDSLSKQRDSATALWRGVATIVTPETLLAWPVWSKYPKAVLNQTPEKMQTE